MRMLTRDIVRSLPDELSAATLQAKGAVCVYAELVERDAPLAELEAAEAELDVARVALSECESKLRQLRDSVRLALVQAGAGGWVSENGVIYCDADLRELAE
jgi:ribosomal protein L16/L10AE